MNPPAHLVRLALMLIAAGKIGTLRNNDSGLQPITLFVLLDVEVRIVHSDGLSCAGHCLPGTNR